MKCVYIFDRRVLNKRKSTLLIFDNKLKMPLKTNDDKDFTFVTRNTYKKKELR